MMNVKIFGLVDDGGGGNQNVFKLLCDHLPMAGSWPDIGCVRFINPINLSRFIYFWSCDTHSFKYVRNNLFRSQTSLARSFKKGGISFG